MLPRVSLVAVCAVLLAGCAGAAANERAAAGDERRAVQERTIAYLTAYLGGDGEQACAQLLPAYRARMDARARAEGFAGCADVLGQVGPALFAELPEEDRELARRDYLRPDRVRVELAGDRATAGYTAAASGRIITRIALVRSTAGWRIERLGVRSMPQP
jgi:hypothetical protein